MNRCQRICLVLCFLLLTDALITESKKLQFHLPRSNLRPGFKDDSLPPWLGGGSSEYDVSTGPSSNLCPKDGSICPYPVVEAKKDGEVREKRLVVAVLFGISIITSLANLGLDIYLKIKGCCPVQPLLCKHKERFAFLKDDLARRANEMNDQYTKSENLLVYVKSSNKYNRDIAFNVKRIMDLTGRVIETIDPGLEVKLQNKTYYMRKELEKHNETIKNMNYLELQTEYRSVFDTVEGTLIALTPVISTVGTGMVMFGFHWFKASKLAASTSGMQLAASTKAQKVLGVTSMSKFSSQTVTAQGNALAATSKMAKFMKFAGAAMSILTIAMDVWSAIQKLNACKKMRDDAKKAVDELEKEVPKFEKTEKELEELHQNITTNYNMVKGEITSDEFLQYTAQIKQMALGASNPPDYLKNAAQNITTFDNGIKAAGRIETVELQKKLLFALEDITFSWSCYEKKVKTISYVYEKCKVGWGSLEYLWRDATGSYETNAFSCTTASGHSYTTFSEAETYVAGRSSTEGFSIDCVLNNPNFVKLTCTFWAQGYTTEKNQEKTGLTLAQTEYLISQCQPQDVSPHVANMICLFKQYITLEELVKQYERYNESQVREAYSKCSK